MGDPAALQEALTTGIFTPTHTAEQTATLESIETWLALIEGWVDEVTARAAAPHLPALGQLREMMRRRRAAGGPAEDTFSALLGLTLRPRRLRDAADMWGTLTSAPRDPTARDACGATRTCFPRPRRSPTGGPGSRRPPSRAACRRHRPRDRGTAVGHVGRAEDGDDGEFRHGERRLAGIVGYRVYA